MIETVSLGDRDLHLCLNAQSQALPEEPRGWLYVNKRLGALKKKYHLESEGFLFFDEGPAISIAAQLVQWVRTDIAPGRHYIFLPFDHTVYVATIRVQSGYVLVEKEDLLPFAECIELVGTHPSACQVADLGELSAAFTQRQVALKDLHINLEPGKDNPYLLRRGYSLPELALLALAPGALAGLAWLLLATVEVTEIRDPVPPPPPPPESVQQIDEDLDALAALLRNFSVLLAYNLERVTVKKAGAGYHADAGGGYAQSFSLQRLHRLAGRLQGRISVQKNRWTLTSSGFRPATGATGELLPLVTSFEQYRRFAGANHARFTIVSVNRQRDSAQGLVELGFRYPAPAVLRRWAWQLRQAGLHGQLREARLSAAGHSGWNNLSIVIEITGA